ncbi:MAG: hypothetical protein ACXADH_04415 [Candidatus Kariarchaeaceae archaeon]|jgi:hypothetical protein
MLFKGPNGSMCSTLSGDELLRLTDKVNECSDKVELIRSESQERMDEFKSGQQLFDDMFGG